MKIAIPHSIRLLLQEKYVQQIITQLYKHRNTEDTVVIALPLQEKWWYQICEDPYHEELDDYNRLQYKMNDSKFIDQLIKLKVLLHASAPNYNDEEEEGTSLYIKIVNSAFIYDLYHWMIDKQCIRDYGIFSLHTFSGVAYVNNSKYSLQTGSGLFGVIKAFIEKADHTLTFDEIFKIRNPKSAKEATETDPLSVNQTIKDVKRKLKLKGKLTSLFVCGSGKYMLKADLL